MKRIVLFELLALFCFWCNAQDKTYNKALNNFNGGNYVAALRGWISIPEVYSGYEYKDTWRNLKNCTDRIETKLKDQADKITQLEKDKKDLDKKIKALEEKNPTSSQKEPELERKNNELNASIEEYKGEINRLNNEISKKEDTIKHQDSIIQSQQATAQCNVQTVRQLSDSIGGMNQTIDSLQTCIKGFKKSALTDSNAVKNNDFAYWLLTIADWSKKIDAMNAKLTELSKNEDATLSASDKWKEKSNLKKMIRKLERAERKLLREKQKLVKAQRDWDVQNVTNVPSEDIED